MNDDRLLRRWQPSFDATPFDGIGPSVSGPAMPVVALALMILLAGCAEQSNEKIIRMAYVSGPTELLHSAAQQFASRVAERSGGKLRVKLYASGQLGDDRETVEGLKLRSIDMTVMGCAFHRLVRARIRNGGSSLRVARLSTHRTSLAW